MNKIFYLPFIFTFFTLDLEAQTPPSNDQCSGAILLSSELECNSMAFSTEDATLSLAPGFWCAGNPDDDVWFRFVF